MCPPIDPERSRTKARLTGGRRRAGSCATVGADDVDEQEALAAAAGADEAAVGADDEARVDQAVGVVGLGHDGPPSRWVVKARMGRVSWRGGCPASRGRGWWGWRAWQAERGSALVAPLEQLPGDPLQLVDALVGRAVEGTADVQLDVRGDDEALPGGPVRTRARATTRGRLGAGGGRGRRGRRRAAWRRGRRRARLRPRAAGLRRADSADAPCAAERTTPGAGPAIGDGRADPGPRCISDRTKASVSPAVLRRIRLAARRAPRPSR